MPGCFDAYVCHECLDIFFSIDDFRAHKSESGHRTAAKVTVDGVIELGDRRLALFEPPNDSTSAILDNP
jgi:hypothetical protein